VVHPAGQAHRDGAVVSDRNVKLEVIDVDRQRRPLARLP
jgi:hypothetical protein